jgi:hypothetical protein
VALVAAGLFVAAGCAQTKSKMDRRRDVFADVALRVNDSIRELSPLHAKILPEGGAAPVMFLDAQLKACFEAEPLVGKLEAVEYPPDEEGRPLSAGEGVRHAAEGFRSGVRSCKESKDRAPEAVSKCLLQCMGDWAALVGAVTQMRKDADWVGVKVESIAPVKKK